MTAAAAARLVRLYPPRWRARYGDEFAALLEDHSLSFTTLLDIVRSASAAHVWALSTYLPEARTRIAMVWSAWMIAIVAGVLLYGTVDDSPFVAMMQHDAPARAAWIGIEVGAVEAGIAVALGGAFLAWSVVASSSPAMRRRLLALLGAPAGMAGLVLCWIVAVLLSTHGRWAASPFAVVFDNPGWPPNGARWITGSVTALLLVATFVVTVTSIGRVLRESSGEMVRMSRAGRTIDGDPAHAAARLIPWAAAGMLTLFVSAALWGYTASRAAADAFHEHLGPLGLASSVTCLISVVLFGAAAALALQAARAASAPPVT